MTNEQKLLFDLLRLELGCTSDKSNISFENVNIEKLFELAARHSVAPLVADCILNNEFITDEDIIDGIKSIQLEAIFQYQKQKSELDKIKKLFNENKIPFIPLKGAVIRNIYPEPYLRTCCDIDILVHPEDAERAIAVLKCNGFINDVKYVHDYTIYSPNGVHLELHFDTIVDEKSFADIKAVLNNIWQYAVPKTLDSYEYVLTDEMFYFYHISHLAKHFRAAGCGIRPFVDLWLLNNKVDFDGSKRQELLKQGGLCDFELYMKKLLGVWFDSEQYDEITKKLEKYIFDSGIYGSQHNYYAQKLNRPFDKFKNLVLRIYIKYDIIKYMYPILQKHKWLTPIYQIRRWLEIVFVKDRRNKSKNNIKTVLDVKQDDIDSAKELMELLKL